MKHKPFLLISSLIISMIFTLNIDSQNKNNNYQGIEAYYFHFSSRCSTCKTVESEAKKDILELYGNQIKFQSINLDEKSSNEIAKRLNVSTQSLLLVKGKSQINITNEGFMYAKSNPSKLKLIIKSKVIELSKTR